MEKLEINNVIFEIKKNIVRFGMQNIIILTISI